MVQTLLSWPENSTAGGVFTVVVVFALALAATKVARTVVRRVIRLLAKRSLARSLSSDRPAGGWWQVRTHRVGEDGGIVSEQRRRQRIDAAARMVGHLVSLVIWITATIATFHLLQIDPAFFLSSAGFIGAAIAIGGQHKVNDYLTGLSVHFEDRYGVGDRIIAEIGLGEPFEGVIDHVGLFSTRVRDERSSVHLPNHQLAVVRNLSQEPSTATVKVKAPGDGRDVETTLRNLAGSEGLTEVIFVGDLALRDAADGGLEVDVATTRPLSERSLERLARRFEES